MKRTISCAQRDSIVAEIEAIAERAGLSFATIVGIGVAERSARINISKLKDPQ